MRASASTHAPLCPPPYPVQRWAAVLQQSPYVGQVAAAYAKKIEAIARQPAWWVAGNWVCAGFVWKVESLPVGGHGACLLLAALEGEEVRAAVVA